MYVIMFFSLLSINQATYALVRCYKNVSVIFYGFIPKELMLFMFCSLQPS